MSLEDSIKELNQNILLLIHEIKLLNIKPREDKNRLLPVTKWNQYHDYPSEASIRSLIFNEKNNGASVWIKRIGKRILIDEQEFFNWCKSNPRRKF